MNIVFQLSGRVPNFITQSHLETTEGKFSSPIHTPPQLTPPLHSMDSLLVPHPQNPRPPMPQPLPRDPTTSLLLAATHAALRQPRLP
jgi:hypothetical protein